MWSWGKLSTHFDTLVMPRGTIFLVHWNPGDTPGYTSFMGSLKIDLGGLWVEKMQAPVFENVSVVVSVSQTHGGIKNVYFYCLSPCILQWLLLSLTMDTPTITIFRNQERHLQIPFETITIFHEPWFSLGNVVNKYFNPEIHPLQWRSRPNRQVKRSANYISAVEPCRPRKLKMKLYLK